MSNTRKAKKGASLRQERFASARTSRHALLGNLVAKRAAKVHDRSARETIYFLHDLSQRDTRARHFTCNLFPAWPWPSSVALEESAFDRVARELCEFWPAQCDPRAMKAVAALLPRLCLDPAVSATHATVHGCADLPGLLVQYRLRFEAAAGARIAQTETTRVVWELLDYSLSQRGMVLGEGAWRTGKSYSAQAWAQSHIGQCRYVQLTSARDDASFFRDISRAVGVAAGAQMKPMQMRARIEATLREQHLLLIIDEADWLWPQSVRPLEAPARVNWILTSLVNNGVPVALIGSRNFSRMLSNIERKLRIWGAEQFHGRLRLRRPLPDRPTREDLAAIVRVVAADTNDPARMLLLGHGLKSDVPVAAIESAVARARWFADADSRPLAFEHVERALVEAGTLTAPGPAPAASLTTPRNRLADLPRAHRGTRAVPDAKPPATPESALNFG